ncbi:MAG: phosphate/phosphite/phosphonate ABC transporter substrate-binding protein, partial [Actinomycetota bacterium]|nr:phosphate/phosphite/phosphonate ABC transporter substrate-binding protein [Actinomycetota bacterium]
MKKLVGAVALAFIFAGCGGGSGDEEVLQIGMIPNQNPEEVEAQYEPLGEYLSEELGMEVEVSVPTGYPAVVEAMASDRLDLAHFGALTYVQAKERTEVEPLVTEVNTYTGTTNYRSLIIVPTDSDIEDVSELEGETFAFGSVS